MTPDETSSPDETLSAATETESESVAATETEPGSIESKSVCPPKINSTLHGRVDEETLKQVQDLVSKAWSERTNEPDPAEVQRASRRPPEVHGTEYLVLQELQDELDNLCAALDWTTIEDTMADGELEAAKLRTMLNQQKAHFESHLENVEKAFADLKDEIKWESYWANAYRKVLEVQLVELEDLAMERLIMLNRLQTERHKLRTTEKDLRNMLDLCNNQKDTIKALESQLSYVKWATQWKDSGKQIRANDRDRAKSIADLKIKLAKVNRHAQWLHGSLSMAHAALEELFDSFSAQEMPMLEYNSDPRLYHEFVEYAILDEAFEHVAGEGLSEES
ncbi:hypothetical protein IWX90DRAFT_491483 [Phyllosticta citrichinensis]|uniref:Uncharacterized protein n=1 Tax=Phyllosticta citrichinensis TaxID=1130410 RepID=A0ABR1Y5S5_9PEZI